MNCLFIGIICFVLGVTLDRPATILFKWLWTKIMAIINRG